MALEDMFSLKKSEVEGLITLTSSGVARTGVSLRRGNVALYRFDDLRPVSVRFNPLAYKTRVEPWKKRFNSDFQQLAGRNGCLGESPSDRAENADSKSTFDSERPSGPRTTLE